MCVRVRVCVCVCVCKFDNYMPVIIATTVCTRIGERLYCVCMLVHLCEFLHLFVIWFEAKCSVHAFVSARVVCACVCVFVRMFFICAC